MLMENQQPQLSYAAVAPANSINHYQVPFCLSHVSDMKSCGTNWMTSTNVTQWCRGKAEDATVGS